MRNRVILSLVVLLLVVLGALWWFSPSQVVQRRSRSLMHTLTLRADDGRADRQLGIYPLAALLAQELTLEVADYPEVSGTFARDEVESMYSWFCEHARQSDFKIKEFREIQIRGEQADLTLSMAAMVEVAESRPVDGLYEVSLHWMRENNEWHLRRVRWLSPSR